MIKLGFFCLFVLVLACDTLASSKIDTIYFQGGDRITGDVKSLNNNQLRLSTDDAGTIQVEWNKIDSVKILNSMRVVLQDGQVFYGKLLPSGKARSCFIWSTIGIPRLTALSDIVALSALEDKFVDRLKGTLSSGFSYTKATDIMTLNLNVSINYVANKNQLGLSYDGNVTAQDTLESKHRQNGEFTFLRILPRKWFLISKLTFESNSEHQLDLRTSFAGGGGKSIIYTNRSQLHISGALQANKEKSKGGDGYNVEGLFGMVYSVFIYESPEVSFNLSADLTPSLNDLGRVRSEIDSNLKWEIFKDFYLKWTFFYSFDSKPPTEGAQKSDWAVSLLGIEYKL